MSNFLRALDEFIYVNLFCELQSASILLLYSLQDQEAYVISEVISKLL